MLSQRLITCVAGTQVSERGSYLSQLLRNLSQGLFRYWCKWAEEDLLLTLKIQAKLLSFKFPLNKVVSCTSQNSPLKRKCVSQHAKHYSLKLCNGVNCVLIGVTAQLLGLNIIEV